MRCKECRQLLYEYIDNTLPPEQSTLLRVHLDGCSSCSTAYAQEKELSREFHETSGRLGKEFHFQFRRPATVDRKPAPASSWLALPAVKCATAAILLAVLIVCMREGIVRHHKMQLDRTAEVSVLGKAVKQQTQSGQQTAHEEGTIQIISIEGASGQLDETHYRWETDGLIAEITVEVGTPRVLPNSKG